eukprot:GDKH01000754.1.p1 GENE.GDKH01000754.1~~GDKH01000754.1.p1  ORF type:complete len:417 (+),score=55.00 GDKH01000754.1:1-1251(+)
MGKTDSGVAITFALMPSVMLKVIRVALCVGIPAAALSISFQDGVTIDSSDIHLGYEAVEYRSQFWAACEEFSGWSVGACKEAVGDVRKRLGNIPEELLPDFAAVILYTRGAFMHGPHGELRRQHGMNISSSFRTPLLLTLSGLTQLSRLETIQQYKRDVVYRGEGEHTGAMCPDSAVPEAGLFQTGVQAPLHAFSSTTMNDQEAVGWSAGGTVQIIKLLDDSGPYLGPLGILHQYEVVMAPLVILKSIGCERLQLTFGGETSSVIVEYLYVLPPNGEELMPVDELALVGEMRSRALYEDRELCWPASCLQDNDGLCSGQSSDHPVDLPLEHSRCVDRDSSSDDDDDEDDNNIKKGEERSSATSVGPTTTLPWSDATGIATPTAAPSPSPVQGIALPWRATDDKARDRSKFLSVLNA